DQPPRGRRAAGCGNDAAGIAGGGGARRAAAIHKRKDAVASMNAEVATRNVRNAEVGTRNSTVGSCRERPCTTVPHSDFRVPRSCDIFHKLQLLIPWQPIPSFVPAS